MCYTTIILIVTCNLVFAKKKGSPLKIGGGGRGPLEIDSFLFI